MKLLLYYHTIRSLKLVQLWYRVPMLKNIGRPVSDEILNFTEIGKVNGWMPSISFATNYKGDKTFTFLNRSHTFEDDLDWDFKDYGLLWTYNLNYFEFLEQRDMDVRTAYRFIDDYLSQYSKITVGHDPYPVSLRLVFWIRFFIRQSRPPAVQYLRALHNQAKELQMQLEYHLLGNHLLENAFALLFAGAYLGDAIMMHQARGLLYKQLDAQILQDGGHFELSPMYHQLMLFRLLDTINLSRACGIDTKGSILPFLEQKASAMLGWMDQMSFSDGSFPLFNDAAYQIAPSSTAIKSYAERLGISSRVLPLGPSGYRKWNGDKWEMIMDLGNPGPPYQPGHAHCDALSFVLHVNSKPVLVDTGTSVYGGDRERRTLERGTESHNTVQIDDHEQSEIWGDFRMARMARVTISKETDECIEASHNGFFFGHDIHIRKFQRADRKIYIYDRIVDVNPEKSVARFHFHPDITLTKTEDSYFRFGDGQIQFEDAQYVEVFSYEYASQFGKRTNATGLSVTFKKKLTTEITLNFF